jgi:hypothetical protein
MAPKTARNLFLGEMINLQLKLFIYRHFGTKVWAIGIFFNLPFSYQLSAAGQKINLLCKGVCAIMSVVRILQNMNLISMHGICAT